jgi:hypothetical protein
MPGGVGMKQGLVGFPGNGLGHNLLQV